MVTTRKVLGALLAASLISAAPALVQARRAPDVTDSTRYAAEGVGLADSYAYMRIKYGKFDANHLDLYLPKVRKFDRTPIVVYVHSGGWIDGEEDEVEYAGFITAQLSRGWAVATADFRLAKAPVVNSEGVVVRAVNPFPAQIRDIKRAIRFVKGYSDGCMVWADSKWEVKLGLPTCLRERSLDLDKNTVVMAGFSAGAHLSMLAATSCHLDTSGTHCRPFFEPRLSALNALDAPLIDEDSRPAAAISVAAVMNMTAASHQGLLLLPIRWLLGCGGLDQPCDYASLRDYAPTKYLDPTDPPIYFAYGPRDALLPESIHADPYIPKYESVMSPGRFWADRMDGPAGLWLDLQPSNCFGCEPGDGVPEYYTTGGHDTTFINADAVRNFLEKIRTGALTPLG